MSNFGYPNREKSGFGDRAIVYASVFICLLPLIIFRSRFAQLYWFGDDWDLISAYDTLGLRNWMFQRHVESLSPVFKLLWVTAIWFLRGSYFGLVCLLWATRTVILALFARILAGYGVGAWVRSFAVIAAGLPWSNIETLGSLLIGYPWSRHTARWSGWRGIEVREAVQHTPDGQRFGLPEITAGRARELIRKYGLH